MIIDEGDFIASIITSLALGFLGGIMFLIAVASNRVEHFRKHIERVNKQGSTEGD
jgi:hypothetical protein